MMLKSDQNFPALQYLAADNIHSSEVTAIFATRNGGVSGQTPETEHLRSLNLNFYSDGENAEDAAENYRIIASSQGFGVEDVIGVQQYHTDTIITVDEKTVLENRTFYCLDEKADALVTNVKGVLLSVRTADCVPILLYDGRNGAVGAVHAGWRGTFEQIATKTIKRMTERYGTNAADIQAAIGPAIGACCYEVGMDFYEQFHKQYGEDINDFFTVTLRNAYCDLKAMNIAFLMEAGVPESNIDVSELCTMCNPELFFSHRRSDTKRGAMAAFIGMK